MLPHLKRRMPLLPRRGGQRLIQACTVAQHRMHIGRERMQRLQAPQDRPIERHEHHNDPDVYYQSLPDVMLEEQKVHADYDRYHSERVRHEN